MITKGEHLTCTNGHIIADVLCDLRIGDMPNTWGQAFGNWRQTETPVVGSRYVPTCAVCGAQFAAIDSIGWMVHIGNRWEPPVSLP